MLLKKEFVLFFFSRGTVKDKAELECNCLQILKEHLDKTIVALVKLATNF
jgi:hypothetical protein